MQMEVEQLIETDMRSLIALSKSVGWDYDEREVATVFRVGRVFGFKDERGRVIGSAALILYENRKVASIGMVIVDPDYRGKGLGRAVTQACIDAAGDEYTLMLVATEDGKKLYEKMGFEEWAYVHKYVRLKMNGSVQTGLTKSASSYRPYQNKDFFQLALLDEQAFGAGRERLLKQRLTQCERCIVFVNGEEQITAYGMAVSTPVYTVIGPVVARCSEQAKQLIDLLLGDESENVRIDLPKQDKMIASYLTDHGFKLNAEPPIMVRGNERMIKRNGELYALAAQIFG